MPSGSYEHELGFGNMGPARVKKLADSLITPESAFAMRSRQWQRGWALLALFILLTACVAVDGGIEDYFIQQGSDAIDSGMAHCCSTALLSLAAL